MFASKDLFFSKPSGYQISRSVRLRSSASAYLNRTFTTPTNNKIWTWSGWVKRGALGATSYRLMSSNISGDDAIRFDAATPDTLRCYFNGATSADLRTTQVFRDPSAWYHIVVAVDTTQATASNRVKIYVNGVQVTAFGTATYPTQNYNTSINASGANYLGASYVPSEYFDGYLTEVNFIDGQALTPSSFGQTNSVTGVWQPIKYTGTYGTNGFYLNFSDNSNNTATTIGKDYSGNGNNWTPNNISVTAGVTYDSMLDVPTLFADGGNGRGNYAVWNRLAAVLTVSDGNLRATAAANTQSVTNSIAFPSNGKYYCEATFTTLTSSTTLIGFSSNRTNYRSNGQIYQNSSLLGTYATYTANDVIGVAVDVDNSQVSYYKNNSLQATVTNANTDELLLAYFELSGHSCVVNFGQRPFTYTPPTGYVALNTQNLPTPTISNGANYMAATTYTGNATARSIANTVNGVSMQPDFVWIKDRSVVRDHRLIDSVRGVGLELYSDLTSGEVTDSIGLTAFNSNGFSLGTSAGYNANGNSLIAWQWKAGGTSSSNTNGSITSTVSVGATQGFSVVTFTANASQTVGHGLGVAPKMIIVKSRQYATNWVTYHASLGNTGYVSLDTTSAVSTTSIVWNNTSPTSTVFTIGSGFTTALWGNSVAYCFSEVAGYSKFGSYTGNGSTDGPFVYCGFRPRFILWKRTDAVADWGVIDTARDTYNTTGYDLAPNSSAAEGSGYTVDFLSNGFKIRLTATRINASGGTYIFMAFAENPLKNSLAR